MRTALEKNYLVISDLHLGEDLRPGAATLTYLRHLARLEKELEDFLRYYTAHRRDGRPWRLVVNGDMVDFMSVMILPEAPVPGDSDDGDEEDHQYGLGFGERESQRKLERVFSRHPGVFRRLAEFVAAGNDLVIVVGNHDVEFHYPSVQCTMTAGLCALAAGDEAERAAMAARIEFCPWFYYAENLIYIEHGHQYDEYCSFDYLLHPVAPERNKKSRIALSVAHAGMRYFANQIPHFDPHIAERWSVVDYAKYAWAQGLRGAIRLLYLYGLMVWRLVALWYWLRGADVERRALHQKRLRELSSQLAMSEEKLVALDALRHEPVTRRLWKLLAALFLDRLLLGMVVVVAAALLASRMHGWWRLAGPVLAVGALAWGNQALDRIRLKDSGIRMRAATAHILALVRAPFIVFGHSHTPETVRLKGGGTYFNTGTWASEDATHAFTHLMVVGDEDGRPRAELRQWRDGGSDIYRG